MGMDTAGDAASRRSFRRTVRLEGVYDLTKYYFYGQFWPYIPLQQAPGVASGTPFTFSTIAETTTEPGYTAKNLRMYIDRACYFSTFWQQSSMSALNPSVNIYWHFGGHSGAQQSNVGSFATSDDQGTGGGEYWHAPSVPRKYMRPLMRVGPSNISRSYPITKKAGAALGLTSHPLPATLLSDPTLTTCHFAVRWSSSGGWIRNWNSSGNVYPIYFMDYRQAGAIDATTGRFTYIKTVNNTTVKLPDEGIAAQVLEANNRLLYDGQLTRHLGDPSLFAGLNRRAFFTNLGVSTVIQRLSFDTASGMADLTFGAPTHLGPQDLIALQRAGKGTA